MTTAVTTPTSLHARRLSRVHLGLAAVAGVAVAVLLFAVTPLAGTAELVIVAAVLAGASVVVLTWRVEGRRPAVDRLAFAGMTSTLVLALLPLAAVLGYTVARGVKRLNGNFLRFSMAGVGPLDPRGGAYHAIVGTVEQVLLASLIAVPVGVLVAIYVTEYGRGRLVTAIRFFIDVMTGVPSIVAGLFVFAFWVLALHRGFSGFAGALSLAILMLPVVVRSTEEMIKLVPATLREASFALGVPRWRTIVSIVLPTAASGITTGIMLAVARVTGETAPLLLTVGGSNYINNNPFRGGQSALPLFVYDQTGSAFDVAVSRAWAGALTLIVIVVLLYVGARLLTARSAVAARR